MKEFPPKEKSPAGTGVRVTVKKRKNDTASTEMIPGTLIGKQSAATQPRDTGKRTPVRLFRLEGTNEHAAIREVSSGVRNKRKFKRLILAELQFIADAASPAKGSERLELPLPHIGPKQPSKALRKLEREMDSVENFADRIEARFRAGTFGLGAPVPPVRELRRYFNDLKEYANQLGLGAERRPPKRRSRPETRLIVSLAEFVRRTKGSPCRAPLATLLFRPTGVKYNEVSLTKLVEYHRTKARGSRLYARFWFPYGLD